VGRASQKQAPKVLPVAVVVVEAEAAGQRCSVQDACAVARVQEQPWEEGRVVVEAVVAAAAEAEAARRATWAELVSDDVAAAAEAEGEVGSSAHTHSRSGHCAVATGRAAAGNAVAGWSTKDC
jgi:hypothetical protein